MGYFTPTTFKTMLLSIVGASIGALIYFWGSPSTHESQVFITTSEFITWFFINEVVFAAYPILILLIWKPLTLLSKHIRSIRAEVSGSSILLLVLFLIPQWVGIFVVQIDPLPLEYSNAKMFIFMLVGFFASALPLSVGIWLTQAAIHDTFFKATQTQNDIKDFFRLRDYLKQFLMSLGAFLSLLTLASAALRSVAIASGATDVNHYPVVYLLLFGVYYTLLLAIVYFPSYHSLVSARLRLLDVYFELPPPNAGGWAKAYAGRKQLEEILELKGGLVQQLITSTTLLSPFVSAILTALVKV